MDRLLFDINEKANEAKLIHETQTEAKKDALEKEQASANEVRKLAMESLAETKKRKRSEDSESSSCSSDNAKSPTSDKTKQRKMSGLGNFIFFKIKSWAGLPAMWKGTKS